jgi:hypothetical protein
MAEIRVVHYLTNSSVRSAAKKKPTLRLSAKKAR